jgi:hypothetical protein
MQLDRSTLFAIIAAFAVGYWAASETQPRPPDRPVLSWIARAAKTLLWVAAFAEQPPADRHDARIVQHAIGEDGYPVIDHGRGL